MDESRELHRDPKGGGEGRELGGEVLGDEGSGNPGRGRGRMEEERRIRERRRREEEGRRREERMRGGLVFLVMQVLEIPAGGRGFPLVSHKILKLMGYSR